MKTSDNVHRANAPRPAPCARVGEGERRERMFCGLSGKQGYQEGSGGLKTLSACVARTGLKSLTYGGLLMG